jgi:ATP-dependent RNA helicase HelY
VEKLISPAEKFAAAKKRTSHPITQHFVDSFDFSFDEFQIAACHSVEDGHGVLVAAPTGAGKTVVGEFAAFLSLQHGKKCFYTTPIKALSNQKYQEFVDRFGSENVGLLTGDTNVNSEAPVLVMTTEVLRNMLYQGSNTLSNLGSVVMDEVHYLADKFRGAVWEEVLIHLMESVQVISLSATVSNAEEFGEWLGEVRGTIDVIVSEVRPIPLYQHVLIGNKLVDLFSRPGQINSEILKLESEALRKVRHRGNRSSRWVDDLNKLSRPEIIEKLDRMSLLPAITFIFSRVGCDAAVKQCLDSGLKLTNSEEREEIIKTANRYTQNLAQEDLEILGHAQWLTALERGIAAHHAGLLPSFKSAVEDLFQRGLVKAVFATETLALGINMPAKTVVLEKLLKYNGEAHVAITPGEFTQLTGRAGRRGIDIEGNAIIQWSPSIDSGTAAGLASTRTYPLRSSFSPTYNMAVNLISRFGRERARGSLESSFAQFQADRAVIGLVKQQKRNQKAIDELLEQAKCHLGAFNEYARIRHDIKELENLLSKRGGNRSFDNKQRTHMESEIEDLRRAMKNHICHSCHDREAHARFSEKADRLMRENDGLNNRVMNRTHVIAKTFDKICQVLTLLGYIEGEKLLPQGLILSKIYAESDLLLTESIRRGFFNDLSPSEIVSVASTLIVESRNQEELSPKIPNDNVAQALASITSVWAELEELEIEVGVKTQRPPDLGFCYMIYRWANGSSLNQVLKGSDMSVGDFVRSTKQLVDLLGQIANAAPDLNKKCRQAVNLIDRGVITYLLADV